MERKPLYKDWINSPLGKLHFGDKLNVPPGLQGHSPAIREAAIVFMRTRENTRAPDSARLCDGTLKTWCFQMIKSGHPGGQKVWGAAVRLMRTVARLSGDKSTDGQFFDQFDAGNLFKKMPAEVAEYESILAHARKHGSWTAPDVESVENVHREVVAV